MLNPDIKLEQIQTESRYLPEFFVNRESELRIIRQKVKKLQSGSVVECSIVNFWGIQGLGKSWLLQHLQHLYKYSSDRTANAVKHLTFALLYHFSDQPADLKNVTKDLADQIVRQLSSALYDKEQWELEEKVETFEDIDTFINTLVQLSERFVPLILLDNTEHVPPEDWEKLERYFIEPLVSTNRVMFVIAGRRQIPRWRRFEVRRRVTEAENTGIRPFHEEEVGQQIARHIEDERLDADLVFSYTAGNPLLVKALLQKLEEWRVTEKFELTAEWLRQHQDDLLLDFLRTVETQLLADIPDELIRVLYAVSILRFYRLEAVRYMLLLTEKDEEEPPYNYYLQLIRALDQRTDIVWWDRAQRAYITSPVIRSLINRRLLLENKAHTYIEKHGRAIDMYWKWVRDYPETGEKYILEIWFHLASLYAADADLNQLQAKTQEALKFAKKHLKNDRRDVLHEQLQHDRELVDLLPADVYETLSQKLA